MRFVKGVLALVTLTAVVLGMPVGIATFGQLPDPAQWADRSPLDILLTPDDGTLLINVLTVGAWLAWGVFTVSVLLELVSVLSRYRFRPRLPGLKLPQALAAGLIVAVIAMFVVQTVLPRGAAPSAPPNPVAAVVQTADAPRTTAIGAGGDTALPAADRAQVDDKQAEEKKDKRTRLHTVTKGEDLWSIAEQYYGQGDQWRTIATANAKLLKHGPDDLQIGWQLVIPGAGDTSEVSRVVVVKGDTLSSLAKEHLGSSAQWKTLYQANRAVVDDPDLITIGTVLVVPDRAGQTDQAVDEGGLAGDPRSNDHEGGEGTTSATAPQEEGQLDGDPRGNDQQGGGGTTSATAPQEEGQLDGDPRQQEPPRGGGGVAPYSAQDQARDDQQDGSGELGGSGQQDGTGQQDRGQQVDEVDPALLAPGIGGLLAAGALTGIAGRRLWQLRQRPVGRRLPHAPSWAAGVERALGHQQDPIALQAMDKAMRLVSDHCRRTGEGVPRLLSASVGPGGVELEMSRAGLLAPAPFAVGGRVWVAGLAAIADAAEVDAVRPWPALVSLGTRGDGSYVLVNLEEMSLLDVHGDHEVAFGVQTAVAMELAMSLWAEELQVVLVADATNGVEAPWVAALDVANVHTCPSAAEALQHLEQRAWQQRTALGEADWFGTQRIDPDTAEAWAPEVFVFLGSLDSREEERLTRALQDSPVSMAAVTRGGHQQVGGPRGCTRMEVTREVARLRPAGVQFAPQYVDAEVRSAVQELLVTSGSDRTTEAPWWRTDDDVRIAGTGATGHSGGRVQAMEPVPSDPRGSIGNSAPPPAQGSAIREESAVYSAPSAAPPDLGHPVIRMIGPIELVGFRGVAPSRAAKQCIEYAAFLLENPGSTAPAMKAGLIVAEGTRRSNMSRLRAWLGETEEGPYLPDAYSGRIFLDDAVSSDWQHLQMLVAAGVNRTPTSALTAALELVRGAPLADAAPQQWQWAEEVRTDMVSVIRDIGVELCNRALEKRQIDLARWSAARALAAAPGDEFLMGARIRTEHAAGNAADVQRLALQVSSQARRLGVDLSDETINLLQQVIEGSVRARSV